MSKTEKIVSTTLLPFLETRIAEWYAAKYGDGVAVNISRTILKLQEEVGELAEALLADDHNHACEEAADVAIVLTHLVRGLGSSLQAEMEKKQTVIEKRLAAKLAKGNGKRPGHGKLAKVKGE